MTWAASRRHARAVRRDPGTVHAGIVPAVVHLGERAAAGQGAPGAPRGAGPPGPRCCPARTSWPSSLSTRSRSVPTGTPIRERRSGSPRSGASPAGAGAERAGRRPGLPGSPPGRRVLPGHRPDGSQRPRRRRAGRAVPAWCHHAVFTDSPFTLLQAEEQHRGHARAEQVFADWTDGPLAHPALRLVPRQRRLAGTGRHQRQPAACRRIPGQPHIRLGQGRHRAPRPHRRRGPPSASRPVPQPADEKRSPEFTRWIQA